MRPILSILMLGGAKRVSMARELIAAGKAHGVDVYIYSHELDHQEPIASVGKIIVGNKYSADGIMNEMRDIIKSFQIDIVLPFIDPSIEIARLCAERYGVFSPTSGTEVSAKLFDKVLGAELFASAEIAIPTTYHTIDEIKYPVILKPRFGSASHGIIIAKTREEIPADIDFSGYLAQQYIAEREEYTLDCYIGMTDGEIKAIVPRLRIATVGGEVSKTQTCRIPRLIALGEKVIKTLGLQGCVTLQFIHDKSTGQFLLMEINPRLGGGVICSINAGANIADMIISECLGETARKANVWRDGALMTRYMQEVMFYND